MNTEIFTSTATSLADGFFAGIIIGYFVKKIIKILIFVAGGIFALLLYIHQQQIISVKLDKLEASSASIITDNITQIGDITAQRVPLAGGLSAEFVIGLMRGPLKR